jgi:hypothetical protein
MELAQYAPIKAEIAKLLDRNAKLVFDYRTPVGMRDARSHIHELRGTKGDVERTRVALKADALAYGRRVDAVAKELTAAVDAAIAVHQKPIDEIEASAAAKRAETERIAAEAKAEAERVEREKQEVALRAAREEAARAQAEIEAMKKKEREEQIRRDAAETARKEAEAKAEAERQASAARERKAIEDAARAEREKQQAILDVERAKIAAEREAVAAKEREIAARAKAEQDAKLAQEQAVVAEKARAAKEAEAKQKAEAERLASVKVRDELLKAIEADVQMAMDDVRSTQCAARKVAVAIYKGQISNVLVWEKTIYDADPPRTRSRARVRNRQSC